MGFQNQTPTSKNGFEETSMCSTTTLSELNSTTFYYYLILFLVANYLKISVFKNVFIKEEVDSFQIGY